MEGRDGGGALIEGRVLMEEGVDEGLETVGGWLELTVKSRVC